MKYDIIKKGASQKSLLFLMFVVFILMLSGCSKEDDLIDEEDEAVSPGTVLLFFTLSGLNPDTGEGNSNTIRSAVSTDGYNFRIHSENWMIPELALADPAVWLGDENLWMLASNTTSGNLLRFTSASPCPTFDSDSFTFLQRYDPTKEKGDPSLNIVGGVPDIISVPEGYRLFYATEKGIESLLFSGDLKTFEEEGVRLAFEEEMPVSLISDPAVAIRADGSYVMYFKAVPDSVGASQSPYDHNVYRATSDDGITFVAEDMEIPIIEHASVPAIYTDKEGHVWIYYLNFAAGFPEETETVWATYEEEDYKLAEPKEVTFTPAPLAPLWVNDPDPLLLPDDVDFSKCSSEE